MTTSQSPQLNTTKFWKPNMADVVSAVVLLGTAKGLQSITITKLGSSGGYSVSSVISGSLEHEVLMSLFGQRLTSAILLQEKLSAGTLSPQVDHLRNDAADGDVDD